MKKIRRAVSSLLGLLGLLVLASLGVMLAWLLGSQRGLPEQQPQPTQRVSALQTQTPTAEPVEPDIVTPDATEETPPPVPTPLPTPVVTPIPVAQPPFIPGLEDVVPQPFHVILREGNAVWTVNSDGSDRRLLIDTESKAGLYLGHHPLQGTEGRRLSWGGVSPDGATLALVVTDLWEVEYKGQPFGWQIYLFDVQTGAFRFLAEGLEPVWSPDGTRIAYVGGGAGPWYRGGALRIADVASGATHEVFPVAEEYWVSNLAWSPDGRRIALFHGEASLAAPVEGLIVNTDESEEPYVWTPPAVWAPGNIAWAPDGKSILFTFSEMDPETAQWFDNVWRRDLDGQGAVRLTTDTTVSSLVPRPQGGEWIVFAGTRHYEQPESPYDLWLVSTDGGRLYRLTGDLANDGDPRWSPDGTHIVFRRGNEGVWVLNLVDGSTNQVYAGLADFEATR